MIIYIKIEDELELNNINKIFKTVYNLEYTSSSNFSFLLEGIRKGRHLFFYFDTNQSSSNYYEVLATRENFERMINTHSSNYLFISANLFILENALDKLEEKLKNKKT